MGTTGLGFTTDGRTVSHVRIFCSTTVFCKLAALTNESKLNNGGRCRRLDFLGASGGSAHARRLQRVALSRCVALWVRVSRFLGNFGYGNKIRSRNAMLKQLQQSSVLQPVCQPCFCQILSNFRNFSFGILVKHNRKLQSTDPNP